MELDDAAKVENRGDEAAAASAVNADGGSQEQDAEVAVDLAGMDEQQAEAQQEEQPQVGAGKKGCSRRGLPCQSPHPYLACTCWVHT